MVNHKKKINKLLKIIIKKKKYMLKKMTNLINQKIKMRNNLKVKFLEHKSKKIYKNHKKNQKIIQTIN